MTASAPLPSQKTAEQRAHEPSMEEILASIRRIIADDQVLPLTPRPAVAPPKPESNVAPMRPFPRADEAATRPEQAAEAPPAPVLRPVPVQRDEVAKAPDTARAAETDFAAADRRRPSFGRPEPRDEISQEFRRSLDEEVPARMDAAPSVPEDEPRRAQPAPQATEERRRTDAGRFEQPEMPDLEEEEEAAPAAALLSVDANASVSSAFQSLASSVMMQKSGMIEQSIREMLRPMLKQWLDDNLPPLVERLVRAEIERVARGGN